MRRRLLVILDYSGTLSLDAPNFAHFENLDRHLEKSGLKSFGISTPEIFWHKIVNPTWIDGSTSQAGYKHVMHERIKALNENMSERDDVKLYEAVSAFVDVYLRHSKIDPRWRSILQELASSRAAKVVIATDHYAEITRLIIDELTSWNIVAAVVDREKTSADIGRHIILANSADVGYHKSTRQFWRTVKALLGSGQYERIILIDDFGCNEQQDDIYANPIAVEKRTQQTIDILEDVFSKPIEIVPFVLAGMSQQDITDSIKKISSLIARYIGK